MREESSENAVRPTVLSRIDLTRFQRGTGAKFVRCEDDNLELEISSGGFSYAAISKVIKWGGCGGADPLGIAVDATLLEGAFSVSIIDETKQIMVFGLPISELGRKQHNVALPDDLPERFRLIISNHQTDGQSRTHLILHDIAIVQSYKLFGSLLDKKANSVTAALQDYVRVAVRSELSGAEIDSVQVEMDVPFSRAAASDYLHLLELWNLCDPLARTSMEPRDCPACGSHDHRFLFKSYDSYPFHACEECGVWFVPLKIDESLFDTFWARSPDAKQVAASMMLQREKGTRDSDRKRFGHYFDLLKPVLEGYDEVRYLDIGCGVGHSVEFARELGFAATGVETNETAVETARAHGRNVIADLRSIGGQRFDLISLFETLEHLVEPDVVMASVVGSLAPKGLVIVTVPNRASWEISILRQDCFHVYGGADGVGHINLFHIQGLERLFQRHGLDVAFVDGQFGSDLLQVFLGLSAANLDLIAVMKSEKPMLRVPSGPYAILNGIGPAISLLDRVQNRLPILIAVGGRPEALEELGPALARMQAARSAQILNQLESV